MFIEVLTTACKFCLRFSKVSLTVRNTILCCPSADLIQSRASHASVVLGDYMWVFGGFSLNSAEPFDNLVRYVCILYCLHVQYLAK